MMGLAAAALQFPEEDDLEILRDLESDAGDEGLPELPEEEEEGDEGGAGGAEGKGRQAAAAQQEPGPQPMDLDATSIAAAAPAAAAAASAAQQQQEQQLQPAPAALPAPSALSHPGGAAAPAQQPQQGGAGAGDLDWLLAGAQQLGGAGAGAAPGALGEGDMLAFGAVLGSLEEDPIARRTRAHHNLHDITLDQLEQMLQVGGWWVVARRVQVEVVVPGWCVDGAVQCGAGLGWAGLRGVGLR